MENTIDIRKKIHDFIDHADERILRIFNAIINTEEDSKEELSKEFKAILDKRMQDHKENPTSGKSWADVRNSLKEKHGL